MQRLMNVLLTLKEKWSGNPYIKKVGKLSPYTIFAYVRDIKVFWNWLLREGYIERNLLVSFPLPKVPKLVT